MTLVEEIVDVGIFTRTVSPHLVKVVLLFPDDVVTASFSGSVFVPAEIVMTVEVFGWVLVAFTDQLS